MMITVEKWSTLLLSYRFHFFSRLIRNPLVIQVMAGTIMNPLAWRIPSFSPNAYSFLYSVLSEMVPVCSIWIQHQYWKGMGISTTPQPCLHCFYVVTKSYLSVRSSELLRFMGLTLHRCTHYGWIVDLFGGENQPISSLVKTDLIINSTVFHHPSPSLIPWMNSHS